MARKKSPPIEEAARKLGGCKIPDPVKEKITERIKRSYLRNDARITT